MRSEATGGEPGCGVEGVADPIIASRTERAILRDMGQEAATDASLVGEVLAPCSPVPKSGREDREGQPRLERRARRSRRRGPARRALTC